MKRILLFALLILGMSLELGAQAKIYTKKMKVADFTDKTLKVVLSGGEMADAPFKARVLDHWRISPYEFCTLSEFERDKADTNLYFMFIAGKNDGLDHLEVVKGSKVPGENLEKMLSVVSLPLRATGEKGTRYLSYLGAYLDIFQEFILEAMHNDIVGYSGLSNKAFRARAEKGSVFLVADCDVAEMPDEAMTAALKSAADDGRRLVLFGAQSFWEGVDVPGEALSCVVLARLPFPQVGEPIVEARSEKVTELGGSAFRDYMLPEAIIKFRQGFGRLVRSKSDRGVVVVTDSRMGTKNYGALFRRALPASVHSTASAEDLVSRARDFLE